MTELDELSHVIAVLRGQGLAIGVDDVPRIAAVLHHTRGWPRDRRARALRAVVARSAAERDQFDHVAPLVLAPAEARAAQESPATVEPPPGASIAGPAAGQSAADDPRPIWPLLGGGVSLVAAIALALYAVWPTAMPALPIDAAIVAPQLPGDAGRPVDLTVAGETHQIIVHEPSSLPGTLRGIAEASGAASLLLLAWLLLALDARRRGRAAIERLASSSGRRMVRLTADREALHPIDRAAISSLAHLLAAPELVERETTIDPVATVELTARNGGWLTLCFEREREQPALLLIEDVSRSMERWPAHATQLARALEAQGQPVEHGFIAGDPLQISDRRSLDGRTMQLEDATAGARVVIVSDATHFDREVARTARHARALDGTIWLLPRPDELWRAGARWVNGQTRALPLGDVPSSLAPHGGVAPPWSPPRPCADADETADAWRSALADDAYLAFAATALLDLAASWSALLVWTLISERVIALPWRRFERIWDLPELAMLPGGRINLSPQLRDRLLADARRERPDLVARVARWIDTRLVASIDAAGESSLGAAVGEVYRDRVARAAGLDGSGARVRQLAERGLSAVVAAHVSEEERATWRVRDPDASLAVRLRGPLLGLALLGTAGFATASAVAPASRSVLRTVAVDPEPGDAGSDAADAVIDAAGDAARAAPRDAGLDGPRLVPDSARPVRRDAAPSVAVTVDSIDPDHGVAGTTVTIRGSGFAKVDSWAVKVESWMVRFGPGIAVNPSDVSDTELRVTVPRGLPPGRTEIAVLRFTEDFSGLYGTLQFTVDPPPDAGVPDAGFNDVNLAGAVTIGKDQKIQGRRITIAAGAVIRVQHGATLTLEGEEIVVTGPAEIDGTGDDGAPGKGPSSLDERFMDDRDYFAVLKASKDFCPRSGGDGSNGGPGATIVLKASVIQDKALSVRVDGGHGGRGGQGKGVSYRLVDDFDPDRVVRTTPRGSKFLSREAVKARNLYVVDDFTCPDGPDGKPGTAGPPGSFTRSLRPTGK